VNKKAAIIAARNRAERDLTISDGALRLLLRLCSRLYVSPKARLETAFPLPWSEVAILCGINDHVSARRRIGELVKAGYLKPDGLKGCPPINHFFLNSNCREKPTIENREKPTINCRENTPDHISNSLREERLKERGGKKIGSPSARQLTTGEFNGSASPRPLTDAEKKSLAETLRRFRTEKKD